jgi:ribosomal protein L4
VAAARSRGSKKAPAEHVSVRLAYQFGAVAVSPLVLLAKRITASRKAKRQAIRQSLSAASADGKIIVIEDIISKDGKTAELVKLLAKIDAKRNVLIVVSQKTPELERAARNIQGVRLVSATYVNVYDVLNADCIVFTQPALTATTNWLSVTSPTKSTKAAGPVEETK